MQKKTIFWIFAGIVLFFLVFGGHQVSAQTSNCRNLPPQEWYEVRSKSFTLIYPEVYVDIAPNGFQSNIENLEKQYTLLSRIFKEELDLPIMIRIYPDKVSYSCLNMYEPEITHELGFSRIGKREISLVITVKTLDDIFNGDYFVQGVTSQLTQIYVARLTDEKSPPGLLEGTANYLENKKVLIDFPTQPSQSWRRIWEGKPEPSKISYYAETLSIVAYLIDVYEWPSFVNFLNNLATSSSFPEALVLTYKKDFSTLQKEWEGYYHLFVQSRWNVNAIYNYDLQVIQESISIGAYTELRLKLNEIRPFLEETGQKLVLEKASDLIDIATKGEKAGLIVKQARQALQAGDYEGCLELCDQAEVLYSELNDNRRMKELEEYRWVALQILELRTVLDNLEINIDQLSYVDVVTKLNSLGHQFEYFGDQISCDRVQEIQNNLNQKQLNEYKNSFSGLGLGVIVILALRMLFLFRKRPVEVL